MPPILKGAKYVNLYNKRHFVLVGIILLSVVWIVIMGTYFVFDIIDKLKRRKEKKNGNYTNNVH